LLRLDKAEDWLVELAEGSIALKDGALTDDVRIGMAFDVVAVEEAWMEYKGA
jgi:hypothetical protein